MLRIRLRRVGKKKFPSYRVVVAEQESPRDGAFLETLGAYDPHADPPSINLNEDRAREWIGKGAKPSEAAEKILRRVGVIEGGPMPRVQKPANETGTAAPAAEAPASAAVAEAPPETETADEPAEAAAETEPEAEPTATEESES